MPIVQVEVEFRYEAAHWLPGVPEGHQCGRMHGHSYHLTVAVRGPVEPDSGFVIDFAHVKAVVATDVAGIAHQTLNEIAGLDNPTVENQLVWFWEQINILDGLCELRLRETANNSAVYRG